MKINFILLFYLAVMCVFAIPYMMSLNSEPSTASLFTGGVIWLTCLAAFIAVGYITFSQKEEVVNPLMSIQFWLHVAKMYRLEIDNLAFDLERRYHYFQNDAESIYKATRFSTYFNSKKDWFFLSLKNSNNMKLLSRRIIEVLS